MRRQRYAPGAEHYIYAEHVDLTTGPGTPRMPNAQILSRSHRDALMAPDKQVLFSGEKFLEGKDVRGKRVLVFPFGATGGWVAVAASNGGAARVDFAGGAGGELGTDPAKPTRNGNRSPDDKDIPSNEISMNDMSKIDRLQDALDGSANIHITLDPHRAQG